MAIRSSHEGKRRGKRIKEYFVELTILRAAGAFKAKAAGELDYKMIIWL